MKLNVRNARQAALFELELKGQISDGHWENSRGTDWQTWCKVVPVVRPEAVGRDFYVRKDNFNLVSKELLEVVGKRMCVYARLADEGFSIDQIRAMEDLMDLDGNFRGVPDGTDKYWDNVRSQILFLLESVPNAVAIVKHACSDDSGYGMKELREDLKDLKTIFKTRSI
jgi:hypothetical protein